MAAAVQANMKLRQMCAMLQVRALAGEASFAS